MYNKLEADEPKKGFAVCVKGLDFPDDDLSVRLGKNFFHYFVLLQNNLCEFPALISINGIH